MDEITQLIAKSQAGDETAREELVKRNLGLIRYILKRFAKRGYDMEDLFQIGSIGLLKAVDRFDLSLGLAFSTYAVPMITGEIKRFLRDDGMIKVSRILKENAYKLSETRYAFQKRTGREPTMEELCTLTGLSREDILLSAEAETRVESIYSETYREESEITHTGIYEDTEKNQVLDKLLVRQLIDKLKDSDRQLIYMRFFMDKTQAQTAQELGISQVQVSRLEKKILLYLRQFL